MKPCPVVTWLSGHFILFAHILCGCGDGGRVSSDADGVWQMSAPPWIRIDQDCATLTQKLIAMVPAVIVSLCISISALPIKQTGNSAAFA
jgi:hypothetical protein